MRYRSRRSIRHALRAGKPSARHDVTTSSRPSAYVGKEGRQPKSRRKRAFDVKKEELKRRGPYRPKTMSPSHPRIRRGGGAPRRRAHSPPKSARGARPTSTVWPKPGFWAFPGLAKTAG